VTSPVSGSAGYIALPVTTDADTLATNALTYLAQQQPGWVAREGHLEVWMIRAFARMCAETAQVAAQVPLSIFQYYGSQLMNLPPLTGSAASMNATFTLTDTQGHLIPAGTVVSYPAASTTNVLFQTTADITVPAGSNATGTGAVVLTAITAGADANGLAPRALSLVSNLSFVASVVSTTTSAGGTDAESQSAYLDRLAAELQLMSPRPILPNDFAVLARNQSGVARATAIDGYNTSNGTSGNSRTVGVSVVDANGAALSSGQMSAIATSLQALREANFVVGVAAPNYNTVNITATLKAVSGANTATVSSAATTALQSYLSPANWGGPAPAWTNQTVVRYLTIAGILDNIPNVSYVSNLQIGVNAGAMAAADGNLTGAFPLTQPGSITITVT
jgi:uncharacterized phage protein gp47/JayE